MNKYFINEDLTFEVNENLTARVENIKDLATLAGDIPVPVSGDIPIVYVDNFYKKHIPKIKNPEIKLGEKEGRKRKINKRIKTIRKFIDNE